MTSSPQPQRQASLDETGDSGVMPGSWLRDPLALGLFAFTLIVYLVSMPKTVALEDDSIFILAGYFNGISHPPGYPLYTLILNLFTQIPIGEIAARAHASSAFFAALACCGLFHIFCLVGLERRISALVSLVFALSATFWSQAIITEVYSLNAFLNLGLLLFALRIHMKFGAPGNGEDSIKSDFLLFSMLLGLALCNHWPLTVLAAPAYLLLVARAFFNLRNKLVAVLPALIVVVIFYLWLYANNQSSPFINFNGKFADFREFVAYVLRSHYGGVDSQSTAGWADKFQFAGDLAIQSLRELNLLIIFAGIGVYHLFTTPQTRLVGIALAWAVFANSFLLVLLLNFDYGQLYSLVFKVYPITSIAILFVLAGYGLVVITRSENPAMTSRFIVFVLAAALTLNIFFSLPQNFRHHYSWGEEYAQKILSDVPVGATLFSDGDIELGLLSYYRFAEGQRTDIKLYSSSALLLDNRLFDYRLEDKKGFIETLVNENPQQQFYAAKNYYDVETVSGTLYTDKLGKSETRPQQSVTSTDIELLKRWSANGDASDPWTRIAVARLRQKAIAIMTPLLKQAIDASIKEYVSTSITELIQSDADALHFLTYLLHDEVELNTGFFETQLANIDRGRLSSKQDRAHYTYIAARSSQAQQSSEHIAQSRRLACGSWPSRQNSYCRPASGS